MRLYEFEAKKLFGEFGIPLPESRHVTGKDDALRASEELSFPLVVKSQVLTGGRGKAGGIKTVSNRDELEKSVEELFNLKIKGFPVTSLLIEKALNIDREIYLGITINRAEYKRSVIGSEAGGVEIETVADESPEKIQRIDLEIDDNLYSFQAIRLAGKIGIPSEEMRDFSEIALGLFNFFVSYDAKLAEINPLVLTRDGDLIAADARVSLDDDSLFRHPDLKEMGIERRHEEGELTPREVQAREWGIPYLDLDGDIGMFPGGAGFGIMGNDFIRYFGGRPANFMDSGGGPSPERIARMLILLDENPQVKAIFGARFGGISRCDDFAMGVVKFLKEHGLSKPMVVRMTGNMWQEGVKIFEEARRESPELFGNIEFHGIEVPIEEIAKRAVELAGETK
ncbi:MAG: acetate--CoA ligase family protein [Candidatus Zixiibacteriota bacterium]|nr:MAG: acetate--CoA ligase family protein [candidate division Zixibacteria bacterium]